MYSNTEVLGVLVFFSLFIISQYFLPEEIEKNISYINVRLIFILDIAT